jgi:hypothetical protein
MLFNILIVDDNVSILIAASVDVDSESVTDVDSESVTMALITTIRTNSEI